MEAGEGEANGAPTAELENENAVDDADNEADDDDMEVVEEEKEEVARIVDDDDPREALVGK